MDRTPRRSWPARPQPDLRPLLVGLIIVGLLSAAPLALAQADDSGTVDGHPVGGAWVVTDALIPEAVPSTTVAHPDGTIVFFREDGPFSGVWESTGGDSAVVTFVATPPDGVVTLRAEVTIAADGESFTGTYTVEPGCLCGESLGQFGPGEVAGSPIHAEPPGEPTGPLAALQPSPSPLPAPAPDASAAPLEE